MRWLLAFAAVALLACDPPLPAPRGPLPALASPGPLIAKHAALACTDCHLAGSPLLAANACGRCHSTLDDRTLRGEGLHATATVRGQACADCHRDHRGARFDARWGFFGGVERFDHGFTGWTLDRGHRIACVRCHALATAATPSFTGASIACATCHAPPHAGTPFAKLGCESCHRGADAWAALSFDHDEKTTFEAGASHRHVACASCHTPQLGAGAPPRACAACHASRDPHAGRFAAMACESCHAPRMAFAPGQPPPAWKPNVFDHRRTRWPLTGRHSAITCGACHVVPGSAGFATLGRGQDCRGCHAHRDVHDRKYTNADCAKCHVAPG